MAKQRGYPIRSGIDNRGYGLRYCNCEQNKSGVLAPPRLRNVGLTQCYIWSLPPKKHWEKMNIVGEGDGGPE